MPATPPDCRPAPSDWVLRHAPLIRAGGTVLDFACGSGRHLRWFAEQGWRPTGLDRDATAIAGLAGLGELIVADAESGPWPLQGRVFDAVVVTNYLWRPRLARLLEAVADGGVLIYETFGADQASIGRPARPEFLLQPGELLQACSGLRIVAYEDGFLADPGRFVQRIAACRPHGADTPARHRLPAWPGPPGPRLESPACEERT